MSWLPEEDVQNLQEAARAFEAETGTAILHLAAARLGSTLEYHHEPLAYWMVVDRVRDRHEPPCLRLKGTYGSIARGGVLNVSLSELLGRFSERIPNTHAYQMLYHAHALLPVREHADVASLHDTIVPRLFAAGPTEKIQRLASIAENMSYRALRDAWEYLDRGLRGRHLPDFRMGRMRALIAEHAINSSIAHYLLDGMTPQRELHQAVRSMIGCTTLRCLLESGHGVPRNTAEGRWVFALAEASWFHRGVAPSVAVKPVNAGPVVEPMSLGMP